MNKSNPVLLYLLVALALVLSACGSMPSPGSDNTGGGKPLASEYAGMIDTIVGDQWTVNGITVTIDPSVVRDGPFSPGDQVKLEGSFDDDGSFTVTRVESLGAVDAALLPQFGDDDGNANSNDDDGDDANSNDDDGNSNSSDDNGNDANSNDDDGNSNSSDDNGNDANSNDDDGNSNSSDDNGNDDDGNANSNDDDGNSNSNDDDDDDDNGNDD